MSSILRYIGAKDIDLYNKIKDDYELYCEPFSGSFSTGIKLINSGYKGRTIINDIDCFVTNFWNCIVKDSERVYKHCEDYNKQIYELRNHVEREIFLNRLLDSQDEFERAAAEYLYRQHLTMNGLSWSKESLQHDIYDFIVTESALASTEIFNCSYDMIIKSSDSEKTFMLIDPPYEIKSVDRYYRGNCKEFNHDELAKLMYRLKSGWLLTYNNNEHIRKLYKSYNIFEVTRNLMGNKYIELYITNTNINFSS